MRPKLWKFERRAAAMGYEVVAGVDEVGMGPLAGPVVGGAVVLRIGDRIPGLNDSKLMTPEEREQVDAIIRRRAVAVAVCAVDHTQVDRLGLVKARILASAGAVAGLAVKAEYLLIDAFDIPDAPLPQIAVVRGDKIDVLRHGDVRQGRLYYLRGKVGREARIRERRRLVPETQDESAAEPEAVEEEAAEGAETQEA